jgi:hypothetical protein
MYYVMEFDQVRPGGFELGFEGRAQSRRYWGSNENIFFRGGVAKLGGGSMTLWVLWLGFRVWGFGNFNFQSWF